MLNNMSYLWVAVAIVWGGMFFYMVSLVRRQQRLEQEIESLERTLAEIERDSALKKEWAEVR